MLSKIKIDYDKPLILDCMDLSSSIGHGAVPRLIIEKQVEQLRQVNLWEAKEKRQAQILQVGISEEIRLLHPEATGPVNLGSLKVFVPDELTYAKDHGTGGLLQAGSRLSDALYLLAEIALAYRRCGFKQRIGIMLTTDGWNRNPDPKLSANNEPGMRDRDPAFGHGKWIAHSEAHALHSINAARDEHIQFQLSGFVEKLGMDKFNAFVAGVGLTRDEVKVTEWNAKNPLGVSVAVAETFADRGRFLEDCTRIR